MNTTLLELKSAGLKDLNTFLSKIFSRKGDVYVKEARRASQEMAAAGLLLDVTLVTTFGEEKMRDLDPPTAVSMVITLMRRVGLEFKIEYSK